MRIESSFAVPADRATAWALLMDVPRVVPCMPGAELVEEVDESNWKANMNVKMGPIALTFATDVRREEADEDAGRVLLSAKAREIRGRGAAQATIESTLAAADGGTSIGVVTDLALSGAVARYGRGIVLDVTEQLVARFADGLRSELEGHENGRPETPRQAKPVSGLRLVLHAAWASLTRPFRGS